MTVYKLCDWKAVDVEIGQWNLHVMSDVIEIFKFTLLIANGNSLDFGILCICSECTKKYVHKLRTSIRICVTEK